MLPKGLRGKDYITEITRLINEWLVESPIRKYPVYTLHVMLVLILQKPLKSSKRKYHIAALKQRLEKSSFCNFKEEWPTFKAGYQRLNWWKTSMWYQESSTSKGNVNSTIKLLLNIEGGMLPLIKETI